LLLLVTSWLLLGVWIYLGLLLLRHLLVARAIVFFGRWAPVPPRARAARRRGAGAPVGAGGHGLRLGAWRLPLPSSHRALVGCWRLARGSRGSAVAAVAAQWAASPACGVARGEVRARPRARGASAAGRGRRRRVGHGPWAVGRVGRRSWVGGERGLGLLGVWVVAQQAVRGSGWQLLAVSGSGSGSGISSWVVVVAVAVRSYGCC
jgi:hypothetical protein